MYQDELCVPSRGFGSTCTRCQERKVRCSHTQGRVKRRADGEQGGSVPKRLRRTEETGGSNALEERKVKALESIAFGLDRLTSVVERVEEEVRAQVDLEALRAFNEARFPLREWDRHERFADWIINASENWVQDKLEGKDVEGEL